MGIENPPQWAKDEAYHMFGVAGAYFDSAAVEVFARYIAEHEEPPVDPVFEAVEDALAAFYPGPGGSWPGTNPMARAVVDELTKHGLVATRTQTGVSDNG